MFTTFVVLCLVSTAFAQVSGFRGCPDVEPDPNFDVSKVSLIGDLTLLHWKNYNIIIPGISDL